MSIEALNWALGHMQREEIESSTAFVLMILANRADPEGVCWPSVRYIMARTKLADSTVRAACKRIADLGLLGIEEQKRQDGGKGTNRYLLRLDVPPPPPIGGGLPTAPGEGVRRDAAGAPPPIGGQETKVKTPLPDGKGERTRTGTKKFPMPDDFKLDDDLVKWSVDHGLPREYVDQQFEAFVDDARSNRRLHADWPAAFRQWLRRQPSFDKGAVRPMKGALAHGAQKELDRRCAWPGKQHANRCTISTETTHVGSGVCLCGDHLRLHNKLAGKNVTPEDRIAFERKELAHAS